MMLSSRFCSGAPGLLHKYGRRTHFRMGLATGLDLTAGVVSMITWRVHATASTGPAAKCAHTSAILLLAVLVGVAAGGLTYLAQRSLPGAALVVGHPTTVARCC